jgi:hypothetical protein
MTSVQVISMIIGRELEVIKSHTTQLVFLSKARTSFSGCSLFLAEVKEWQEVSFPVFYSLQIKQNPLVNIELQLGREEEQRIVCGKTLYTPTSLPAYLPMSIPTNSTFLQRPETNYSC